MCFQLIILGAPVVVHHSGSIRPSYGYYGPLIWRLAQAILKVDGKKRQGDGDKKFTERKVNRLSQLICSNMLENTPTESVNTIIINVEAPFQIDPLCCFSVRSGCPPIFT